ncbi:hypothetical protein [Paenarthrobacter sp. Y-19]|nr:hypothetical protein [Paenarthrobacter sp. Y-19]
MSTEEPLGGIQDEKQGGVQITNQKHLTRASAAEKPGLLETTSVEDRRTAQLAAMEARYPDMFEAS